MMDFGTLIKNIAPWIGTAIGGPAGPLLGMAIKAAGDALGVPATTVDDLQTAFVGANPDQLLALKKADNDFSLQMKALGFKQVTDLEAIAAGDRSNARELLKTTRSWVPAFLSISITAGYFVVLLMMIYGHAPDSQALFLMLGSLGTAWTGTIAFWFGTTADSGRKTELMAAQNNPAATTVVPLKKAA